MLHPPVETSVDRHLDKLEAESVYVLREAFSHFKKMGMLWSIGKDSTVMLWLARKAFFGHVPLWNTSPRNISTTTLRSCT